MIQASAGYSGHISSAWQAASAGQSARHAGRSQQSASEQASAQQAGSIAVRTADGDIVKITFASSESLQTAGYSARSGRSSQSASAGTASADLAVRVDVQGTLSDKEVDDISHLMSSLLGAVAAARQGDLGGVAAQMSDTTSLDSVAAYRFAYQEQSSITRSINVQA